MRTVQYIIMKKLFLTFVIVIAIFANNYIEQCDCSAATRLYDSLFGKSQLHMRKIRPTDHNMTDVLTLFVGLQLSQLIDVDEKNQIMTTNVWLRHTWQDDSLRWNPNQHNGVDKLYIPPNLLWLPDLVLYNNADGNYVVTLMTKVTVFHDGRILWEPPAIFKSSCQINVEFFPFDEQECFMKFGTWTHDGFQVDLKHIHQKINGSMSEPNGDFYAENGIQLDNFYDSVEWDVTDVPAKKSVKKYPCCAEPFPDIIFYVKLRRKTLFYTVNLIVPCIAISLLTVFVFYLPSDSGEKITLSVSILLALTVFFLLLAEIIPPTSFVVPLIGKYLIFTMILVTLSIIVTVLVLNVHFRDPITNNMPPWVRQLFLCLLPKILCMRRPTSICRYRTNNAQQENPSHSQNEKLPAFHQTREIKRVPLPGLELKKSDIMEPLLFQKFCMEQDKEEQKEKEKHKMNNSKICDHCEETNKKDKQKRTYREICYALDGVKYITEHLQFEDFKFELRQDWHFAALVMDRIFLIIFSTAVLLGTLGIVLQAPSLFHKKPALQLASSSQE